jgi:hypothetical protein
VIPRESSRGLPFSPTTTRDGRYRPRGEAIFQSGWFIESLRSQTLIVHMIRTERVPLIQSRAAVPVLLLTSVIMGVGLYLPYSTLGAAVGCEKRDR